MEFQHIDIIFVCLIDLSEWKLALVFLCLLVNPTHPPLEMCGNWQVTLGVDGPNFFV